MPLTKLNFAPGIDKQNTEYGAEGRWIDSDNVRFHYGLPQKVGGWQKLIDDTLIGVARDIHAWTSLDGVRYTALGTDRKFYIYTEGTIADVTPIRKTTSSISNPFTTNGTNNVTVTDNGHQASLGDFVTFDSFSAIDGLDMNAEFEITSITDSNNYVVTQTSNASGSTSGGGGTGNINYQISIGPDASVYGYGWGIGTWNTGTWNTPRSTSTVTLDGRNWSFDNFGEDLIATVHKGGTFRWDTSAGLTTRATVISQAPTTSRFNLVSMPDRHVFLFGTETTIGDATTRDDLFLRFSSQEDFTTWTPTATNTSGSFRIQDGSKIVAAVRSRNAVLVWTDNSLHALQFVGAPFTFSLVELGANCGAVGVHSAVDINGVAYWMSQNSFYLYDGTVKKLPCSVQDYVFEDFSIANYPETYAGINSEFNEITWFYPSAASTQIDRAVTYNYLEKSWHTSNLDRTTWSDYGVYQQPYATKYFPNNTATTPTVIGLTAGATTFYEHEVGFDDDGTAMTAFITSGDFDIQDGQQMLSISRGIPDFKDQVGDATIKLGLKSFPSQTSTDISRTITTNTTKFDLRGRGRQANVDIRSTDVGANWRYGTLRLDVKPDGGR
jgi:hypothetical protein